MTTAAAWVGLRDAFGNPSMEDIIICVFPRTLNIIWYTASKQMTIGEAASQELSVKNRRWDKESVLTGGLLPHKDPLCFI